MKQITLPCPGSDPSHRTCLLSVLLGALLLIFPAPAQVSAQQTLTGAQILEQVDKNLQPGDLEMYRKIINIEPDGRTKEFVLWFLKKDQDKVVTLFVSPASETGRATLRLGDNMWLFIPNVGRPIRITSMQSVVGGVFNNADIMRLDYHVEYDVATMEEDQGRYLLDLKAKTGSVAYDRLKMWVLKEELVPTKIECYAATGMLIKTLHFKEIKDIGDGVVRPAVMETDSPLYKGYKSIMISANLKKRSLADEVFTLNYLPRIKDLR
jgi:outer membrane lipoprotein-sorting protein